jgi:hypothetical protein
MHFWHNKLCVYVLDAFIDGDYIPPVFWSSNFVKHCVKFPYYVCGFVSWCDVRFGCILVWNEGQLLKPCLKLWIDWYEYSWVVSMHEPMSTQPSSTHEFSTLGTQSWVVPNNIFTVTLSEAGIRCRDSVSGKFVIICDYWLLTVVGCWQEDIAIQVSKPDKEQVIATLAGVKIATVDSTLDNVKVIRNRYCFWQPGPSHLLSSWFDQTNLFATSSSVRHFKMDATGEACIVNGVTFILCYPHVNNYCLILFFKLSFWRKR